MSSTEPDPPGTPPASPFPRALILTMVVLAGLLVVGVGTIGVLFGGSTPTTAPSTADTTDRTGPLAVVPVPAPAQDSPDCTALVGALPSSLVSGSQTLTRRELRRPAPAATVAWGNPQTDPIVLRCGLERPAELTPTAQLLDVSGVRWLQIPGSGSTTWLVVDRAVYVALTESTDAGTGPLQDISAAVRATLPAKQVDTQPLSPEPTPSR